MTSAFPFLDDNTGSQPCHEVKYYNMNALTLFVLSHTMVANLLCGCVCLCVGVVGEISGVHLMTKWVQEGFKNTGLWKCPVQKSKIMLVRM
jgi:hypothetical protein